MAKPTLYKKEYCEKLIDHMTGGLSFCAFAGLVGVSKQTIFTWTSKHVEFAEAKAIAIEKARLFWERAGIEAFHDKSKNPAIWIFTMKCRFREEWGERITDKQLNELTPSEIKILTEHFSSLKGEK